MHAFLAVARGIEESRSGFVECAEPAHGFVVGLVRRDAASHQLLGAQRQVQLDLILDVALPTVFPPKGQLKRPPNAGPDHVDVAVGSPSFAALRIAVTVSAYCIQFRVSARRYVRPAAVSL